MSASLDLRSGVSLAARARAEIPLRWEGVWPSKEVMKASPLSAMMIGLLLVLGLGAVWWFWRPRGEFQPSSENEGRKTVRDRVEEFGELARGRLLPKFRGVGATYPPEKVTLVGIKDERVLEVWVSDGGGMKLLKKYPILGASGSLGPKLAEGDRQVPEGLYRIELLNPNSLYHLSLRVSYPNAFDRAKGREDGRQNLGGDIMIHGKSASIGCLAMGDEAAEDLFVLAAETGLENISVILTPVDFRARDLPEVMPQVPPWTPGLYRQIQDELAKLIP